MGQIKEIETGLVLACRRKEDWALSEVYRRYSKGLYFVSLQITNKREDAEDVLQDSFIQAFDQIHTLRDDGSLGAWLKRIVVNRSLNFVKKETKVQRWLNDISQEHSSPEKDDEEDSDETYLDQCTVEDVKKALLEISDGYRMVFSLFVFGDLSHKEIAEQLGVSESTSKSQYNRAKKRLADILTNKMNSHG